MKENRPSAELRRSVFKTIVKNTEEIERSEAEKPAEVCRMAERKYEDSRNADSDFFVMPEQFFSEMYSMMNIQKSRRSFYAAALASVMLFSCRTTRQSRFSVSRAITGEPVLSAQQLTQYFMSKNPGANRKQVQNLANLYIQEGRYEGINSDVAFAQMCLETGYLTFGNLVVPEMHNYCGLGAIDASHPGEWFSTEELGVRAHIQHLHAYATTENVKLNGTLVDNRYKWVRPRGKAPTVFELAGTWAADPLYGEKLDAILEKMQTF